MKKIERIKQGDLPIYEVRLHELINYAYENNAFNFLHQIKKRHLMM